MGEDKALLVYDGMTFLEHIIRAMLLISDDIIVVTDRADRYTLPIGRVVVDVFPNSGPVGAILTGLMAAGSGTHFVVPCDMPAIDPRILELLKQNVIPPFDGAIPEIGGESQPLCGAYNDTAVPELMAYLESGQRSARGALSRLNIKRIGEGVLQRIDSGLTSLININTPEEFAVFRQALGRHVP